MESKSLTLSAKAPVFQLPEPLTGKVWKLDDFQGHPALLVMFICNHCPYVIHLKKDIVKLANDYMPKGLAVVAISSNSTITHPEDGPDFMAEEAKKFGYQFPYLYDETQEVARAFGAVCTPEFFLFKKDGNQPFELAYHGRFDESRPRGDKPVTGSDIRQAIDCVLNGQPVNATQKPRFWQMWAPPPVAPTGDTPRPPLHPCIAPSFPLPTWSIFDLPLAVHPLLTTRNLPHAQPICCRSPHALL